MMKIIALIDSLSTIGESISSRNLILNVIGRLNFRYSVFVYSITKYDSFVTLEDFYSRLVVLEHHLKQRYKEDEHQMFSG